MIKVYLDWNVMAQIKDGKHLELEKILINNTKFLIPYSTSHIGDLLSGFKDDDRQRELIKKDLNFITKLTHNACLFNNGKDIVLDFMSPEEYYQQRLNDRDLIEDLSIDKLLGHYENDKEIGNLVKPFITFLKQTPIFLKETLENPIASQQLEKIFPGLKDNPTMDGFFNAFGKMFKNLNEKDRYKDLREMVQSGLAINKDTISNSENPYQIIQEKYKQLDQVKTEWSTSDKNAPKWFNEISNEYIKLDMHGYYQDRVNITKGRKETFKNVTEDAFHAAFASTCNFYITNDKKAFKKTIQVYQKLQINTIVFKPHQFVEFYKNYLDFIEETQNILIVFEIIKHAEYFEEQIENAIIRTYPLPHFLFDMFNKIIIVFPNNDGSFILLLSRNKPTNGTLYIMEILKLVDDLISVFGQDIDNLGKANEDELKEENWKGRKWKFDQIIFTLVITNGHIQLYFDK